MAIFALPALLLTLVIAVLYGCWWLLPVALVVIGIIAIVRYSWTLAGRVAGAPGGFAAWWTANRQRVAWTLSILVSFVLAGILVYCLVHRYAPACTGGCLDHPAPVAAPGASAPRTSTAHRVSDTFIVTAGPDWTEEVEVPMSGTSDIRWERVDQNTAYQFQSQNGVPVTRHAGPVPHTAHGRIQRVQFRSLDSDPVLIRVTVVK